MEREAAKKKEYSARIKMDIKDIVSDKEVYEMRVADKDQDTLFSADPKRGELLSAEQITDEEEDQMMLDEDDEFEQSGEETLSEIIKDPYTKKR